MANLHGLGANKACACPYLEEIYGFNALHQRDKRTQTNYIHWLPVPFQKHQTDGCTCTLCTRFFTHAIQTVLSNWDIDFFTAKRLTMGECYRHFTHCCLNSVTIGNMYDLFIPHWKVVPVERVQTG